MASNPLEFVVRSFAGRNPKVFSVLVIVAMISSEARSVTLEEILDSTGAGPSTSGCFEPWDIATDANGTLYVACVGSENVVRIGAGGALSEILSYGQNGPIYYGGYAHLAVDSSRNLYLADLDTSGVFKRTPGGALSTLNFGLLNIVLDVVVDALDSVYVSADIGPDQHHGIIKRTPGGVLSEIIGPAGAGAGQPFTGDSYLAVDPDRNIYATAAVSDNAFKIEPDGTITEIIGPLGDNAGNTLDLPRSIAVTDDGIVYVGGLLSNNVFRITPAGVVTEIMDASGDGQGNTLDFPYALAVDSLGSLYVASVNNDNLFRITANGAIERIADATGAGVGKPLHDPGALHVSESESELYVGGLVSNNVFEVELIPPVPMPSAAMSLRWMIAVFIAALGIHATARRLPIA